MIYQGQTKQTNTRKIKKIVCFKLGISLVRPFLALFTQNWFLFKKKKDFDIYNVFIITIRKRPAPKRELKEEDVTRHLVFAFNGFLDRQGKKEPVDEEKVNTI